VPREFYTDVYTWLVLNRGSLSVLMHPLGRTEYEDHTAWAMWLGEVYYLVENNMDRDGGDDPQYAELGLGYAA